MPLHYPFDTSASFCSNFFAYFCPPTLKQLWRDHAATPASSATDQTEFRGTIAECRSFPLLPLLPFVQISSEFCLSADPEAALGDHPATPASNVTTIKREFVEEPSRNASPLPLCYLCFLLFKFILLTSVRQP
jgi:hypothetical protein